MVPDDIPPASPAARALDAWLCVDGTRADFLAGIMGRGASWLGRVRAGEVIPSGTDRDIIIAFGAACNPVQDFTDWSLPE